MQQSRNLVDLRPHKLRTVKFLTRGHSTTTWTRKGGGGLAKTPRLSTQGGGSLDVHVDKNLKKRYTRIIANDYEKSYYFTFCSALT